MTTKTDNTTKARKVTVETLATKVSELEATILALQERVEELPKGRDRGPSSTRTMVEEDAQRVCYGDLKDLPHKTAAKDLGLSYAQVYSARNGYTFKQVHKANETK